MPTRMMVPLPITPNKFLTAKKTDPTTLKGQWKIAKKNAVKVGYKTLNSKFIKSSSDLNKFFEGALTEFQCGKKIKLAGVFGLPDGQDYIVRLHTDQNRIKVLVGSKNPNSKFSEWIAQYLGYLLTL